MIRAVYPGTFDPIHNGHVDIATRAASLFDELIIAVYDSPPKTLTFDTPQRLSLARDALAHLPNVTVTPYHGLTVTFRKGALVSYRPHPYRITETGLRKLSAGEEKAFLKKVARISESLKTAESIALAWGAYLDRYGIQGFKDEVRMILERMESDPRKGAAMFRNRITTLQHSELWRDTLTRIMDGRGRRSPAWMRAIVREWMTRVT